MKMGIKLWLFKAYYLDIEQYPDEINKIDHVLYVGI